MTVPNDIYYYAQLCSVILPFSMITTGYDTVCQLEITISKGVSPSKGFQIQMLLVNKKRTQRKVNREPTTTLPLGVL
jgi:hypothetical protein